MAFYSVKGKGYDPVVGAYTPESPGMCWLTIID
jgi:hypothetical protein